MVEALVALAALGVAAVVLGVLAVVLRGPVRRLARARTGLREEVRTGVAQLRAIAYVRRDRHPRGVDSP